MPLKIIAREWVGYAIDSKESAKSIFISYPNISASAGGITILSKHLQNSEIKITMTKTPQKD